MLDENTEHLSLVPGCWGNRGTIRAFIPSTAFCYAGRAGTSLPPVPTWWIAGTVVALTGPDKAEVNARQRRRGPAPAQA